MRILHTVEFYAPSVGGAQEVVRQISERLARRGHEVTVATTRLAGRPAGIVGGVRIEPFAVAGSSVRGITGEAGRYREYLQRGGFDVMMNYAAQQWASDLAFEDLDRLNCARVFAPCGFSGLYDPRYASYFAAMPAVLRRYDHLILHSGTYRDADFVRRAGVLGVSVIPNGAAAEEFEAPDGGFRERHGIQERTPLLLTVGSHSGLKGHGLVLRAFLRARIGRACLVVIGNSAAGEGCLAGCRRRARAVRALSFGRKRVLLLDPPRREVIAAFRAADLFVLGSNIECSPLVLFEAMASRTPFLTVGCGNAAEIVALSGGGDLAPARTTPGGLVVGDARGMARSVESLMADPQRRARLAENGRRAWRERFEWEDVTSRYEELYRALMRGCASRPAG